MKPADVNEENKDDVWTRVYGYPLDSFPEPKFKVGDHVRVEIKHKKGIRTEFRQRTVRRHGSVSGRPQLVQP